MTRDASWLSSVEPLAEGSHRLVAPPDGLLLLFAVSGVWTAQVGRSSVHCASCQTILIQGPAEAGVTSASGADALLARLKSNGPCEPGAAALFEASHQNLVFGISEPVR
jgi:hypothetical protein